MRLHITHYSSRLMVFKVAEVAELADALGSGSSGRKAVRVRVPPSAFFISLKYKPFLIASLPKPCQ